MPGNTIKIEGTKLLVSDDPIIVLQTIEEINRDQITDAVDDLKYLLKLRKKVSMQAEKL